MIEQTHMATHPDLIELRRRYDAASASPIAEGAAGLAFLGAVFLAASPWIVGFSALTAITVSNLIAGGALAALVIALTAAYGRMHGLTFVVPAIGIWTIVAPWVIVGAMDTTRTIWSNACAGGAIVFFGLVMLAVGFLRARRPAL
ncbi:SPW repeat protein [Trebonia kvetii]|nr:SPW repeat protein [Trebonia kvetii]